MSYVALVRYFPKHIDPIDLGANGFCRQTFAPDRIHMSIRHPSTGREFGVCVENDCGTLSIYGPPFVFGVMKKVIKGTLPHMPTLAELFGLQDKLNHPYA